MKNRFALASIGALVGLAACSDSPVAPSATPVLTKPSFVIESSPIAPVVGQVWVCKVWLGDVGGAPSVATTANPVRSTLTINNAAIANLAPGAGGCTLVATSTASDQDANAGWDEDHIIVTETLDAGTSFVSGKVFFSGGQLTETFNSTTRNQTFNTFHGAVIVFENMVDPVGGEGCTPGYWRQDQHLGNWTSPYDPSDDFDATFGVDFFNPNITLGDAVALGGGGVNALARHAVAALLNAASADVDYEYTTAEVIAIVQNGALSLEARKNLLATENERGCDLERAELN